MQWKYYYTDVPVVTMTTNNILLLYSSSKASKGKEKYYHRVFRGGEEEIKREFANKLPVSFVGLYSYTPIYSCYSQSIYSPDTRGKCYAAKELMKKLSYRQRKKGRGLQWRTLI